MSLALDQNFQNFPMPFFAHILRQLDNLIQETYFFSIKVLLSFKFRCKFNKKLLESTHY